MEKKTHVVSVRMSVENLKAFQALSIIDQRPMSELICEAVKRYVEDRGNDPRVIEQIKITRKRQKDLFRALITPKLVIH